jgi:putative membrane protein
MNHHRTSALIAFAALAASGLGACKGRDSGAYDSAAGRIDSAAAMASTTPADSLNAKASSGWTPPVVIGFVSTANTDEILLGQLGEKKATNAKVKAFARQMVADHRAMMTEVNSMAKKLATAPDTLANDVRDLMSRGRDEIKDLTDKVAGMDWDKDFMDKMVEDHQKVLDRLQDAAKNTTNADLRAGLEKATGKVQQHLTKAQDIKANVLKD